MKLLFQQRLFSWFGSYDIYDEHEQTAYKVQGKLAWGHKLEIHDQNGNKRGTVTEKVISLLPTFAIEVDGQYIGRIRKQFTLLKPKYTLDMNDWQVTGDMLGWNYEVRDAQGTLIMTAEKKLLRLTDTYVIDIVEEKNALLSLMIVLAIDAAIASANS